MNEQQPQHPPNAPTHHPNPENPDSDKPPPRPVDSRLRGNDDGRDGAVAVILDLIQYPQEGGDTPR